MVPRCYIPAPSRQRVTSVLLILFGLLLVMPAASTLGSSATFCCLAPSCGAILADHGWLTRHHSTCASYRQFQQEQLAMHQQRSMSGTIQVPTVRERLSAKRKAPPGLSERKNRQRLHSPLTDLNLQPHLPGPSIQTPQPSNHDPIPPPPPEPSHAVQMPDDTTDSGRPKRATRLPARFQDFVPDVAPIEEVSVSTLPRVTLIVRNRFKTLMTSVFGLWREYLYRPSYDPDSLIEDADLAGNFAPNPLVGIPSESTVPKAQRVGTNATATLLMDWKNNGNVTKSDGEINSLVRDVILDPAFNADELVGFDASRANKQVDEDGKTSFPFMKDFKTTTVDIQIPTGVKRAPPVTLAVPGLYFRNLIDVIKAAFTDPLSQHFHLSPFKLFRKLHGHDTEAIRVYSELYNTDAFIAEHDHIQRHGLLPPNNPECKREKIIAALMFWSDSTHLTNFGTAKLWPIYMLFGNLSKYIGGKPSIGAEHHIAYIPSLPDSIQDRIKSIFTKWNTQKASVLAHCRRELIHAVWRHLLDDEFLYHYRYGIVVTCADGVERRVYPRIFTYSADYPEKVLLATIRENGECPCPRCLTPKSELHLMGQIQDLVNRGSNLIRQYLSSKIAKARRFIYVFGLGVRSSKVEKELKATSSVPTVNAFIDRLGHDFPLHRMLVVDFMHEFELGVWKSLFTHLIRLLYAMPDGPSLVAELDSRYRQVPRFGIDTIRRFATNASEMKKLSARDFEDLLQCAIPVFEGLFSLPTTSEHDLRILKLLYRLAEWHGYAKLRMHTDHTLNHLDMLTSQLGTLMRDFQQTTCTAFRTRELPREARHRHDQALASGSKTSSSTPKSKAFNLNTYKWHSLGDYVQSIRLFGPTDIYSTQIGESLHRLLKRMYMLTNKNGHERQLAQRYMRVARARAAARAHRARQPQHFHLVRSGLSDPLGMVSLRVHHHTSWARRSPIDIPRFVGTQDPAMKDFYPKLQDHILGRLQHREFDGDDHHDFTDADRNTVYVLNNALYATRTLRINYTTYDVRRDYNTVNPLTTPFVMMRAPDGTTHPYWYCKIIGIFHARAYRSLSTGTTPPVSMEIMWVRWMGVVPECPGDLEAAQLPQVGFVPEDDPYAFGFLDPAHIIRASHLIPRFAGGRTNDLLSTRKPTAARSFDETDDWKSYYVDIFADRDMLMRYVGGGVGHLDCGTSSFDSVPPHAEPGPTLPTVTLLQPPAGNATNAEGSDLDLEDINETDVAVDDGDDEVTEIDMENESDEPEFYYDEDYGVGSEEEEEIENGSDCDSQLDNNDLDIHAYSY
ncbi:hypothetical protein MIND_00518800 [Mycena indigotica]|uniref:C2H2-type domain-containing protein n=1 Tax=Mycena indigotica TaxID=2126181 RepID=A0A8H6SXI2_9AGAR|nr:uncharacterized protein MIND_00518800 [Mycena indigotica]KAF7307251.1 hypothetical protein MIND_00518800 [Mycena indigotica]